MIASLLTVCTGNICRSPMAEALFAAWVRRGGFAIETGSAGIAALVGRAPPPEAIRMMAERGLDISGHRASQFTAGMARGYELILVMEARQQRFIATQWPVLSGRVRRLGEVRDEDVTDPYGQAEGAYRLSLDQIDAGVREWTARLS